MARKRDQTAGDMPPSPVAAKLLQEVTQETPAPERKTETPQRSQSTVVPTKTRRQTSKEKPLRKKRATSSLAKTYEARVMMSPDEKKAAKEAVESLQDVTDTEVTRSHMVRALLTLASRATSAIKANREHAEVPARPANNDWRQLAAYEDALADYLLIALRDRRHMDTDE